MNKQSEYPKFISNHPCGQDMYLGKSQEKIAGAIASHIQRIEKLDHGSKKEGEINRLPHIIGLEGDWGSGKSNLIKILKRDHLENTHYFFEYDAWGHQEDLQRRSFLETLTNKLIKDEILPTYTKVKGDNKEDEITWFEKLEDLLARKRKTTTKVNPKLSFAIIFSIILLIITPISTSIASENGLPQWWKYFLYPLPIIIIIAYVFYAIFNKKNLSELFVVYSGEKIQDVVNETISEKEPNVNEFNNWMKDLSKGLNKNLVIVFDNMDRLPANKVKELWSSIHTFFAEIPYDNIWVIITFDKDHLANAFEKFESTADEIESKELTTHFINKTFPVIYRVASPILTDLKLVFGKYFNIAFGNEYITEKEKGTILRIFGIIKPNPTIRDVIAFINELVSLKIIWKEDISLLHIAIFSLTKENIINKENTIAENILSKEYYSEIVYLVGDENDLSESISALSYSIVKEIAKQIPMTQHIRNLFSEKDSQSDINSSSDNPYFLDILSSVIYDFDTALIDRIILRMNNLNNVGLKDKENKLGDIWNYLTLKKTKQEIQSLDFVEEHKILLLKGSQANRELLLKSLCNGFQRYKEKDGAKYYDAFSQLNIFIHDNKLKLEIDIHLVETKVPPKTFIDFVEAAEGEYSKYKLVCENTKLNQYLIDLLPNDMKHTSFFNYLYKGPYKFQKFYEKLKGHILTSTHENFYYLNYAYKILSPKKPLDVLLDQNQIAQLQSNITDESTMGFLDVSAMALGNNMSTTIDQADDVSIKAIAKRIEYYHYYGTLLESCVSWNNPSLNRVLAELTTNPQGNSGVTITKILPLFDQIISKINIEPQILLKRLNPWHEYAEEEITEDNIEQTITYTFYSHSVLIKNDLTKHIHKVARSRLSEIPPDTLFQHRNNPTYYWLATAESLINGKVMRALPDNFVEFVKKVFLNISITPEVPNATVSTIIEKIPPSKITATIKNICTEYYNGRQTINAQMFLFFEPYFRENNRIVNKEGDFTRTILNSVITNAQCKDVILGKSKFYVRVVKKAGDDAEDFKSNIKNLSVSQPSEELSKFMKLIGIDSEDHEE